MANWNNTELSCTDVRQFTKIMKGFIHKESEIDLRDGIAFIRSRNSTPEAEIERISKENPRLTFTARYSLESELYDTAYIEKYKNGKSIDYQLEANYGVCFQDPLNNEDEANENYMGENYKNLFNKAVELFRRIDIIKLNESGNKYIDFNFNTDISLIVENDEYKMQVTKEGPHINEIKCFKKVKEVAIKLVPLQEVIKNELPF